MGYTLYLSRLYTCVLRRRSGLLKVVFLICTVWLTVAFLLFAEQRNSSLGTGSSGTGNNLIDNSNLGYQNRDGLSNNVPKPAALVGDKHIGGDKNVIGGDKISDKKDKKKEDGGAPESGEGGVLVPPNKNVNEAPLFGEMGKPVVLPTTNISPEVKKLIDEGWQKNAFNQYVSDLISLHRKLPDPRDEW